MCAYVCVCPSTFVYTVCRCTRVCGCAARRPTYAALTNTYLLCGPNWPRKRSCMHDTKVCTRVRSRELFKLSFSFWCLPKNGIFLLSVAMKRPAFVLHAFHDIHADFERVFSILRQSLSANDRDVPPRHVSVCRLVRNLGQQ